MGIERIGITTVLKIARTLGSKNTSQVFKFAEELQAIKGAVPGKAKLHLELTPKMYDEFVRGIADVQSGNGVSKSFIDNFLTQYKQMKELLPEQFAKGNKNIIDLYVNRYAAKKGVVRLNLKTVNAGGETLADGTLKAAANESGLKVAVDSKTSLINGDCKADLFVPIGADGPKIPSAEAILRNIDYTAKDGVAKLSLAKTSSNGVKAQAAVKADEKFFNSAAEAASGGQYKNYGDIIQDGKKLLG